MTKAELLAQLEAKKGFHSIIKDDVAPDNVPNDPIEKRFWYVNHLNADGTMGKTFVYYLHDTTNDVAWFYNTEVEAIDIKEPSSNSKKLDILANYIHANFVGGKIVHFDPDNNYAEAKVFDANGEKRIWVYKPQGKPITHVTVEVNAAL